MYPHPKAVLVSSPGSQHTTTSDGFRHTVMIVVRDRFLGTALVLRGLNNLLRPAFTLAIALLSLGVWHAGSSGFGVLRSVWGLSTILGTIVVVPLLVNWLQSVYFFSWLLSGMGFVAIAMSPLYVWALGATIIGALGSPLVHVALDTHIGRHIDKDLQGRIFLALQQFVMSLLSVGGLGLVSWGLGVTTPGSLLPTGGVIMMLAALVGLLWWWRVRPPATALHQGPITDAAGLDG